MTDRILPEQSPPRKILQEDKALAEEAARALESAVADPQSLIDEAIYENQKEQTVFLEGVEREIRHARLDGLCGGSGVVDRRSLGAIARLEALKIEGQRPGQAKGFLVIMADIDGLKRVNDAAGHAVGDELIVGVAGILCGAMREADTVGRYGGDEFFLLAPIESLPSARALMEQTSERFPRGMVYELRLQADQLRQRLANQYENYPTDNPLAERRGYPGQISIGWHFFSANEFLAKYQKCAGLSLDSLVGALAVEADRQMYQQKNTPFISELPRMPRPKLLPADRIFPRRLAG